MTQHSAALAAYHLAGGVHVFLAHPGGPFYTRRDLGHWTLPKGLFDPATEDPWQAARREFTEEVGVPAPAGTPVDLGTVRLPSGKLVHGFAVCAPPTLAYLMSNTFELQWPHGSGRTRHFPEVDRAEWFELAEARRRVHPGQLPLLERLETRITSRARRP